MILNSAVLGSLSKTDKRWFMRVMDISLQTQKYVSGLARAITQNLPTFECHTICRAIAEHIAELKVVDGHYIGVSQSHRKGRVKIQLKYCSHSWLVTPSGSIIDPYPVGFLAANPVLVVNRGKYKNFGGNLYLRDGGVTKRIYTQRLRNKVKILSRIIGEAEHHARSSSNS